MIKKNISRFNRVLYTHFDYAVVMVISINLYYIIIY